jgi:hypothetical protein
MARSFNKLLHFKTHLGTTCINPWKKVLVLKSKMVSVKVFYKIYSETRLEPKLKKMFGALRSRSRKKYFRLRNTAPKFHKYVTFTQWYTECT